MSAVKGRTGLDSSGRVGVSSMEANWQLELLDKELTVS